MTEVSYLAPLPRFDSYEKLIAWLDGLILRIMPEGLTPVTRQALAFQAYTAAIEERVQRVATLQKSLNTCATCLFQASRGLFRRVSLDDGNLGVACDTCVHTLHLTLYDVVKIPQTVLSQPEASMLARYYAAVIKMSYLPTVAAEYVLAASQLMREQDTTEGSVIFAFPVTQNDDLLEFWLENHGSMQFLRAPPTNMTYLCR